MDRVVVVVLKLTTDILIFFLSTLGEVQLAAFGILFNWAIFVFMVRLISNCNACSSSCHGSKYLRDGPLEKLWRGGIFELQELFFVIKFLV